MSNEVMKGWTQEDLEKLVLQKQQGLTWNQIAESFPEQTANSLRKTYYRYMEKEDITPVSGPRVLIIDIETLPMEAYVWGLFDQNIGLEMVKTDWSILSFSAKWLGSPEDEVMYQDTRNEENIRDDSKLLKTIHSLLNEADVLIVQNGVRFDVPKINARFVLNDMKPPTSYRIIDTMRIAKSKFGFTSNKLAYMTDKLCVKYKKLDHGKYAGFKLWDECMKGNLDAFNEMEKYNKYDVLSLEELYTILAPWDKTINFSVFNENLEHRCSCGSSEITEDGFVYTNLAKYQRYVCTNCGKESRDSQNLLTKEKRKSIKR